jgi:hypothetical protein
MPDSRTVLPAPNLLDLIGIRADANVILFAKPRPVQLVALRAASDPEESTPDTRGTWLTWQGVPVTVGLGARTFFCDEGNCDRIIFAERLSTVAARYGRRTERLDGWLLHVYLALGGEVGSRLLKALGVVASGLETPRVLSVDDLAFRCGSRNGTVLVVEVSAAKREQVSSSVCSYIS